MSRWARVVAGICLVLAAPALAQSPAPPIFQDGDRVMFIGDSITHIGKYHIFIADYYATRFPDRRITFLNGGIGGDTVPLTLKRLETDILPAKPNRAILMLGMNDAGGNEVYEGKSRAEIAKARDAMFERYRRVLPDLIEALRKAGMQVTLIMPSPYDETARLAMPALPGKNSVLDVFADFVRDYGRANGLPVVDFHAPMLALNAKVQVTDPKHSLMGKDRVHPGDDGYFAMAAEFLQAQKVPSLVADTHVKADYGSARFEFEYQPKTLPFPMSETYRQMDTLLGFTGHFNREMLTVDGLAPGEYAIEMDGIAIGRYDARALSLGINLATNPLTLEQKQASAVSDLIHQRGVLQAALRDLLWVEFRLKNAGKSPDDEQAARAFGETNPRVSRFLTARKQAPEMERQIAELQEQIYAKNKPQAVHVRVFQVPASAEKAACSEQLVAMRDGVRLATNICLPEGAGPWPVVLVRTPYGKDRQFEKGERPYVSRQIAFVSQDIRGLHRSAGQFRPFRDDGPDGYDTVEWIARQPWSNGKVGMTGASAPGFIADQAALAAPPHLTCLFVTKAVPGTYRYAEYPGGIYLENASDGWMAGRGIKPPPGPRPRFRDYDENTRALDMYGQWAKVKVPAYNVAGWYDPFVQGDIDMFAGLQNYGGGQAKGNQKLDINVTGHGHLESAHDLPEQASRYTPEAEQRWFDYWLKGIDNGIMREPAVHYFVMGANEWKTSANWPPPNEPVRFFLRQPGALSADTPAKDAAPASFRYDPKNPVPTLGGNNLSLPSGNFDQRPVSGRPDVLKFETAPLVTPIEIAGPIQAELWVSTSAEDTDFMAKLVDVAPDGYEAILCDGGLRLRYREGIDRPLRPEKGRPERVTVEMQSTAIVFQRGHRIAIHLTSSNAPKYERHSNTWQPVASYDESVVAGNSIYLDATHPSALILPVMKK